MKKLLVISSLFIVFFAGTAYATDSTPSSDIAARLKEFQQAAASKAAQLKELMSKKLQNKVFAGTIQSRSDDSLTLATRSGPRIVSLSQDTVFESKVKLKQKFSSKNMSTGDYIAALGDADETGVLTAKKVILLPIKNYELKTYLWGQIISVSEDLATLRDKDFKNVAVSISKSSKFRLNDVVILTGGFDKNNIFTAGFAYVIPESGIIKPKKATSSAIIN